MNQINPADTAWMLISTALVMLMTPGLAFFYGGMVQRKNVLGTMMQSFVLLGVVSLQWAFFGYSLAFGPDKYHLIGGLEWAGLRGVGGNPSAYAPTIPHVLFMVYQMMFAVITPALISGAFAERFRFKTYLVFTVVWCTLVYDPICHWVWGIGGWLREMGALDFAGGTVVHISAAAAALAAVLITGRRRVLEDGGSLPHNLTMTLLGTGMLWFGWFGFNAGSALSAGKLSASTFVATHLSACAAALSWGIAEWMHRGKMTTLGVASGAVAGLVAITPAAGYVAAMPAIVIGLLGGLVCYGGVSAKPRMRYDDTLDVIGIHGVGSTFGMFGAGAFASIAINSSITSNGLFLGNAILMQKQAIAVVATGAYSFVVSFVILKVLDAVMGLRVKPDEEDEGLDLSQHNEEGYIM